MTFEDAESLQAKQKPVDRRSWRQTTRVVTKVLCRRLHLTWGRSGSWGCHQLRNQTTVREEPDNRRIVKVSSVRIKREEQKVGGPKLS